MVDGFASFGLSEPLRAALTALGYEEPTPIQRAAIPPLLEGRDVLGQAATGTGKTAAFALPLLQRVTRDGRTRALVLVPTRELAMQVAEAIARYGKGLSASVLAVYGGASIVPQAKALQRGVTVVVATPGRALDHMRRKTLKLGHVEVVILDEADEMLDMGFAEDLEAILEETPATRQTALFSATLPPRITAIAGRHLRDPVRVAIAHETLAQGALPRVRQVGYMVTRHHKPAALARVLDVERPTSVIVFCRTRNEVDEVTEALKLRGHSVEALHGGLSQEQRDRVMKRFRAEATRILVATDVAARGLDIEHVSHVINYDVPSEPEAYVHRIGRTGRAGREGVALTLVEPREQRQLRGIEQLTRQRITMATVPTVSELRARRLERLAAELRATIGAADLGEARAIVESLSGELDVLDIAAAAIQLAYSQSAGASDQTEIPSAATSRAAPIASSKSGAARRAPDSRVIVKPGTKPFAKPFVKPLAKGKARDFSDDIERARIYIGAGKDAQLRPADLVGAIANEANIPARAIGAIEIGERYSIVEVPIAIVEDVITALRATTLKGRKVNVRRDRDKTPLRRS